MKRVEKNKKRQRRSKQNMTKKKWMEKMEINSHTHSVAE